MQKACLTRENASGLFGLDLFWKSRAVKSSSQDGSLSVSEHCESLSGTRLTGGRSGAPRRAHAEDCLSGKPANVAGVREFRRQAGGAFSKGERRSTSERRERWSPAATRD
jgi:hypothetical protein